MFALFLIVFFFGGSSFGQVYYGYKNYTEFEQGNFNLLISIPHDGYMKPTSVPDRNTSDATIIDYNTFKLGQLISDELVRLFKTENKRPFLVINNLHRVKLDPNRDSTVCCTGTANDAYRAYLDYHNFIKKFEHEFMELNAKGYRQGLLIDLHGQSHPDEWVELGYLLTEEQLDETVLSSPHLSSLRLLDAVSPYSFDELIRGAVSLGGILETQLGLKSVPSPLNKSPGTRDYFTGGFITRTYGSIDCKKSRVNALQMEVPYYIRDNKNIVKHSKTLAKAIYDFYHLHGFDKVLNVGVEEMEIDAMVKKCQQNQ